MAAEEPMDWNDAKDSQLRVNGSLKYRGIAIVAIFSKFPKGTEIKNTDKDRALLEKAFQKLQYGVLIWDDTMCKDTFLNRLKKVSSDPVHNSCETFAVVIITHGDKDGKLYAYDTHFRRDDVYDCFKAEKCSGLKNKLKLFIFQACRGNKHGRGVHLSGCSDEHKYLKVQFGDYIEKDNLVLFSTFQGNYAYGATGKGSHFINALSETMLEEAAKNERERKNILALLTEAIRKTAMAEIKVIIDDGQGNKKVMKAKQQPTMMIALHQLYYFMNKEEIPANILEQHKY